VPGGGASGGPGSGAQQGGERLILVPLRSYGAIIEAMRELVGDMAAGPLYYLGKKIGYGLVETVKSRAPGGGIVDVTRALDRVLEELGFGSIYILDAGEETATLKLVDPPSMVGMEIVAGKARSVGQGTNRGYCHLERGMIAAVYEKLLGRRVRVLETESGWSSGRPYCVLKMIALA